MMDSSARGREQLGRLLEHAFPLGECGSFSGLLKAIRTADGASPECSPAMQNDAGDQSGRNESAASTRPEKGLPRGSMPRKWLRIRRSPCGALGAAPSPPRTPNILGEVRPNEFRILCRERQLQLRLPESCAAALRSVL